MSMLTDDMQSSTAWLRRLRDPSTPALVCGILNVTPDSFSDGGCYAEPSVAIRRGIALAEQGCDLIDVGGESTRPGAVAPAPSEELTRVIPVIRRLAHELPGTAISVDTSQPEVMRAAVDSGAVLINDVRALRVPGALEAAGELGAAVCLMHMRGEPTTMQTGVYYADVVADVQAFLQDRRSRAVDAGVDPSMILLDPGFGFGKTHAHNMTLLQRLPELSTLGAPLMVGLSRKSIAGHITGRVVSRRMPASIVLAALAAERGARVVRVHDVGATRDAVAVVHALHSHI